MSDFSIIKDHPDKKEILAKLLSGSEPKDVCDWLKLKYPKKEQSHLRISQKLLTDFKNSQYTNYYEQFTQDLTTVSSNDPDKELSAALTNIKPYRERLKEIADKQLNSLNTIESNLHIVLTRIEQMYDVIQNDPTNARLDNTFIRYMKLLQDGIETIEKIKLNSMDNLSQQNFTMQAVQESIVVMQDAIRETLEEECSSDVAANFMDKLYYKMNQMESPKALSLDEKVREAQKFEGQVIGTTSSDL